MKYFVTGATGFIGRNLVERLLERGGTVHALVRRGSLGRLEDLRARWGVGEDRLIGEVGDVTEPLLGLGGERIADLRGSVDHFIHAAALYDMTADGASIRAANVGGTEHAVELAGAVEAGCFHLVSSIAAAGQYKGTWREDMFNEAQDLDAHPYFRSKHESERVVREWCRRPWRIYRPGIVVGHSETGEMDKVDGPYYFFGLLKRLRGVLPQWVPMLGLEGREINLVPVDYVTRAVDWLAHSPGLDGRTFHLTDPHPMTAGETMNVFARAAGAPRMAMRLDPKVTGLASGALKLGMRLAPPARVVEGQLLRELGIPESALSYIEYPTRFESSATRAELAGSGIEVPPLESYADRLWEYWIRHLDPDLFRNRPLRSAIGGRRVMITGASSGIGRATAIKAGAAGAEVLLVARTAAGLTEVKAEIERNGGSAHAIPCDLSVREDIDRMAAEVIAAHGGVDVLVNNAGRSIRRSVALSYNRLHDFERTMKLNYFGALQLILRFLPGMRERGRGHVINISSIGVQTNAPRFSAYVASKAALDAFSRCAASEVLDDNVHVTTVHMPLVRTPMIEPTKIYDAFPTISPDEAADLITGAMVDHPKKVATALGNFGELVYAIAPKLSDTVLNAGYKLFPESGAARSEPAEGGEPERVEAGEAVEGEEPSSEAMAFAHLTRGVHW